MSRSPLPLTLAQQLFVCQQIVKLSRNKRPLAGELTQRAQHASAAMSRAARMVDERVTAGSPLVDALAGDSSHHSRTLAACVESGQDAGCLDQALESWVGMHLANDRTAKALRNAMLYPVMLIVIMVISIGFVVWRLVPEYHSTYMLFDKQLPFWLETIVWIRTQLGGLLLGIAVLAIVPMAVWWWRRGTRDFRGVPREPVCRMRLAALAAELAAHMLSAGIPLSKLVERCSRIVSADADVADSAMQRLQNQRPLAGLSSETSMLLASLHAGVLDRHAATEHLLSVAELLRVAAETKSAEQVRWLPMLVALSVGGVAALTYVFLIYLPWIFLLRQIVEPVGS